jgi:hypothetical protein
MARRRDPAATVDVAISYGSNWKLSGEQSVGNSPGSLSGFTNKSGAHGGPWAKQWRVPIEYRKQKRIYECNGIQKQMYYRIVPIRYTIPSGWYAGAFGKDVRQLDGPTRYANSNSAYRAKVQPGTYVGVSRGKSVKWKGAATPFNLSLGGSMQYDLGDPPGGDLIEGPPQVESEISERHGRQCGTRR